MKNHTKHIKESMVFPLKMILIDNAVKSGLVDENTKMIQDLNPGQLFYSISFENDPLITHRVVKSVTINPKSDFSRPTVTVEFKDGTSEDFFINTPLNLPMEWNDHYMYYSTSEEYVQQELRRYFNKRFKEIEGNIKTLREERRIYERYLVE